MVPWFIQPVPGLPEENEEIVSWLLENYDLELETVEKINGMAEGIDHPETRACILISLKGRDNLLLSSVI